MLAGYLFIAFVMLAVIGGPLIAIHFHPPED